MPEVPSDPNFKKDLLKAQLGFVYVILVSMFVMFVCVCLCLLMYVYICILCHSGGCIPISMLVTRRLTWIGELHGLVDTLRRC